MESLFIQISDAENFKKLTLVTGFVVQGHTYIYKYITQPNEYFKSTSNKHNLVNTALTHTHTCNNII